MKEETLIKILEMSKGQTTEQLLPKIMECIKPTMIKNEDGTNDTKTYDTFKKYRQRWVKDKINGLKDNALKNLFGYFGYKPITIWIKDTPEREQPTT